MCGVLMPSSPGRKATQVELAKLLNSGEVRLYEIQGSNGLSTVAEVLDAKKSNQKLFLVTIAR
jgi:hypothetical protein